MSFRIKTLSIYSHEGDVRTIKFNPSGLSIITGRAKTGKSSVIDIIDYCLGRGSYYIAEGVIRRSVSWFAIEIENGDDVLFIARRNPDAEQDTSPDVYIRRGLFEQLPNYPDIRKNITLDALVRLVTRFCGIAENENRPISGTRRPLQATIRHALFLCFQKQDEIASRERLFHRQGEDFIPQSIKDTIPYFVGAVDEDQFIRQKELDDARAELRYLESRRDAIARAASDALRQVNKYVLDAKRVNLTSAVFDASNVDAAIGELKRVISIDLGTPSSGDGPGSLIEQLQNELAALRKQLDDVQLEIRSTRHFMHEQTAFSREANEQRARLQTLELFKGKDAAAEHCPVCESELAVATPAVQDLNRSLQKIEKQLEAVSAESPHLQQRLDNLNKKRNGVQETIMGTQRTLEKAYADDARAKALRDQAVERARVVGRIGAFLEQASLTDPTNELNDEIESAKQKVDALIERVGADEVGQRLDTFLNLISTTMTRYAQELDLEHTRGQIRLDLKKLTVVADTITGPVPLYRMGSGENWIGYHVVTLLALHKWLRERERPVPGMLFLDQPSQAHYPPESDDEGSLDALQDADRLAVHNLFELMKIGCDEIGAGFQLIVLDHAKLDDDWFRSAIVEEFRGDNALVPQNWQ